MIIEAILKINPNAKVTVNAEDVNQITWLEGTTPIAIADIEAQISTVRAETEAEATAKATNRTNAIAKLKASTWSPLTDDEATALFG